MNETIDYYNSNAKEFSDSTAYVDFTKTQDRFLSYMKDDALILDFGCGSGRDSRYFLEKGCKVEAIDGSKQLCELARRYTGLDVRCMMFDELNESLRYDGIWACASILHVPSKQLREIIIKMARALKTNGIIYTSFKYGEFEGIRNGRYFTYMTEASYGKLICDIDDLRIEEEWITKDVREERENERWLNIIMRKIYI